MTPEMITAICAGFAVIITAVGTVIVNLKLNKIHGLVNSRLDEALTKITTLETLLAVEKKN